MCLQEGGVDVQTLMELVCLERKGMALRELVTPGMYSKSLESRHVPLKLSRAK